MTKISFVYFDVGGVLVKDFSASNKWEMMKQRMDIPSGRYDEFDKLYDKIEDQVCKGLDIDSFMPMFIEKFNLNLPSHFSWLTYFTDNIDANPGIWEAVKIAKSKYRVGLLTDQYPRLLNVLENDAKLPPIKWDTIVDSSVEGIKKPMREIFELAEERSGAPHEEILFIENNKTNYQATLDFGWQAYLYDPSNYKKSSQDLAKFLDISGK